MLAAMRPSASTQTAATTPAPRPRLVAAPSTAAPDHERGDGARTAGLVRAAAGGDPHAWQALVDRHSGSLRAIARAYRLSSADTEDVVQTTWLRLIEHLPRITSPASVRAWLATTARRECLRVLREGARCPPSEELPDAPLQRDAPGIDARLLETERDEALWRAVGLLPTRDQALLGLLVADPPLSYEQIGTAMDMPTGSIGPTRARCLSRLRRETGRLGLVA
jgi:RNA polymerase sigma factor (sigma-70 family)